MDIRYLHILACSFLLVALAPARPEAAELTFDLIAEDDWLAGRTGPDRFIPGRVLFYPVGSYEPWLAAETGRPVELPAGEWTWIAEAPGWVTVLAGAVAVDSQELVPRSVVTPVVPACRIRVADGDGFRRLRRLDVVSLDRGSVYPLVAGYREETWVPAGRVLIYGIGTRGLTGIGRPFECPPSTERDVELPTPPPAGRQDLMVSFRLPGQIGSPAPSAELVPARAPASSALHSPGATPAAVAWIAQRMTFFFLDAPAGEPSRVEVTHPELRSSRVEIEPRPQEARDLGELSLLRRPDLALSVDYRPLHSHRTAELRLYHCGLRRSPDTILDHRECTEVPPAVPVREGLHEVRFGALDTGQYQVDAVIDGDRVAGAGSYVTPYLGPEDEEFPVVDRIPLWEFEIYGNLLHDGEVVPGTVRLNRSSTGIGSDRDFTTGKDDFYRLTYFATVANRYDLRWAGLPLEELDRPAVERMGLFSQLGALQACSADGFCRVFHERSMLMGGGRLDLDLGDARELEVKVTDARTGEVLPGAAAFYRPASKALRFRDGRVWFDDPPDAHAAGTSADDEGIIRLRALPEETIRLGIFQDGYEPDRRSIEVPPATRIHLDVALEPEIPAGTRIALRGGGSLGGATVLVFTEDGAWDRGCSKAADSEGLVELAADCLNGGAAVVVHPDAAMTTMPAQSFSLLAEVEVPPAPEPPLLLRARDDDGAPLAGVPVIVHLDELRLGPDELGFATATGGLRVHLKTDSKGEVALRGVDPGAAVVPAVALSIAPEEAVSVAGYRSGDVVELVVD